MDTLIAILECSLAIVLSIAYQSRIQGRGFRGAPPNFRQISFIVNVKLGLSEDFAIARPPFLKIPGSARIMKDFPGTMWIM